MLTSLIAGFIGCMVGVSLWTFPDMYKALKRRKQIKKAQKQRLFELEIEAIVINKLQELYNDQETRENSDTHKE